MTPEQRDLAQRTIAKWPELAADLARVMLDAALTENADVGATAEAWCKEHPIVDNPEWMVAIKAARGEELDPVLRARTTEVVDYLVAAGAPAPASCQYVRGDGFGSSDLAALRMRWGHEGKWPYVLATVASDALHVQSKGYLEPGTPLLAETIMDLIK